MITITIFFFCVTASSPLTLQTHLCLFECIFISLLENKMISGYSDAITFYLLENKTIQVKIGAFYVLFSAYKYHIKELRIVTCIVVYSSVFLVLLMLLKGAFTWSWDNVVIWVSAGHMKMSTTWHAELLIQLVWRNKEEKASNCKMGKKNNILGSQSGLITVYNTSSERADLLQHWWCDVITPVNITAPLHLSHFSFSQFSLFSAFDNSLFFACKVSF